MSEQHFNALPSGYQLQEYTLKSVLGHGGFGITYLAADNNLGKDVAIKEYLPTEFAVRRDDSQVQPRSTADNNDYEWGLDRFMKEAQTLGLFRHPNIVPVYRALKANGTAYMVMEYQQGQSLAELFRKHRSDFNEEDLLGLTLPLLDGLAVVHKAGYLHRDLKPGNIFIREDGSPVLLDFGAARNAVGRKSKNLTSIVTPGYAPLEQYFADGNQGPWTDIYATASILYQAVAGRIPPEAPARVKRDPITPAVEAGRGRFSEAFLSGIDIGLRVEEEQRPQTVEQWRAMLLGQEVPAAPPPTMGHHAAASVRTSATMLAGHAPKMAPGGNATLGGSASMRFPTVGHEDALAHKQRRGAGKLAAFVIGGVVLLAAAGAGAYIALNPDHGLFGTSSTKISADAELQRRQEEEARRKADEELRKRQEAEEEARRRGDTEARRKAEEERKKAEEEVRRQEEARKRAEEERRKAEEERKRREEEARRGQGEEERKRAEEEARRQEQARREEETRRREEEARRRDEDAQRRAEEERRRREQEQEEARRREEEERRTPKGVSCELSVIRGVYASETDCFYVIRLFKLTLETARDGAAASTWTNQRSGAAGSIKILATMPGQDGTMCRRFQQTVTVGGRTHTGTGVACFRNNAWQLGT